MTYLTPEQVDVLLRDIRPSRVKQVQGQSHLEAWDVRAALIRMFGFARWTEEALAPTSLIYEEPTTTAKGDAAFVVAYVAHRRLTICGPDGTALAYYDGSAVGESKMPSYKRGDAHDMAIKTAESQALKRCAINLGTQFGLSLYDDGSLADVVKDTLVGKGEAEGD
jgi:recombination DNA repair RAD52 pathway protein